MRIYKTDSNTFSSLSLRVTVRTPTDDHGVCTPCFSVTAEEFVNGVMQSCGCLHEQVLEAFPELEDVVALHLSDADGWPMHAASNGWFWLKGACGIAQDAYISIRNEPEQSLLMLADHLRISDEEAKKLVAATLEQPLLSDAKAHFHSYMQTLVPRWLAEAQAAEAKYGGNE